MLDKRNALLVCKKIREVLESSVFGRLKSRAGLGVNVSN